jgi:hypothetical protein
MVDGMRFRRKRTASAPSTSIIPALAIDRIDILADGASATYGSDAIAGGSTSCPSGLRRAVTQRIFRRRWRPTTSRALWGRTWDGGETTLSMNNTKRPSRHGAFEIIGELQPVGLMTDAARRSRPAPLAAGLRLHDKCAVSARGVGLGTAGTRGTNCSTVSPFPKATARFNPTGGVNLLAPFSPQLNWTNSISRAPGHQWHPQRVGPLLPWYGL